LKYIYPWADLIQVAQEPILQLRHSYQNTWMFIVRAVVFFLIAISMTRRLRSWSLQQDLTTDATPTRKARTLSGPGVVIYSLLGTFIYIDWILSLEKKWYSTMFAVIMLIGQILVTYAFSVVMLTLFKNHDPLAKAVNKTHYHHLGNLL